MKKKLLRLSVMILFAAFSLPANAQNYDIQTIAGDGTKGFAGDNGAATSAEINFPYDVAIDGTGNIYIVDYGNQRIRKMSTGGIITTIAGNGVAGYAGDSGAATAAELQGPSAIAVDDSGKIYIADQYNNRIRKVSTGGIIISVAGNGTYGFSGDNGAATAAELSAPTGIAVDRFGNLYIADQGNNRIRKVSTGGIISTITGDGTAAFTGDNGLATAAEVNGPVNIAVDNSGNLYIADQGNQRIRKISTSNVITTIAGNGNIGFAGDSGSATAAELCYPSDVAIDTAGNVYIADEGKNHIRKINTAGVITNIAGNGTSGFGGDNGLATVAELDGPWGLALDASGNVYIADQYNNRIRELTVTVTGINEISVNNESVEIYPNPSNGIFTVRSAAINCQSIIEVYSMLGEKVYQSEVNTNTVQINMSNQASGVYLFRIHKNDGKLIGKGKFIIQY